MIVLKLNSGDVKQLAQGTDPDLHKLVTYKRDHGEWIFPVMIVSERVKLTNDQCYYDGLGKSDGPTLAERLAMVKKAVADGYTSLRAIEKATGLTRGQVRYLDRRYHPREMELWTADQFNGDGPQLQAGSARDMADLLGLPVVTVRQIARTGGIALGYRIHAETKH